MCQDELGSRADPKGSISPSFFFSAKSVLVILASQCLACHVALSDMRSARGLAVGVRGLVCLEDTAHGRWRSVVASCLLPTWQTPAPRHRGQFPSCPCRCPSGFPKATAGGVGPSRPGRCSDTHATHMRLCYPRPSPDRRLWDLPSSTAWNYSVRQVPKRPGPSPGLWGFRSRPAPGPLGPHVPVHWKSLSVPVRKR